MIRSILVHAFALAAAVVFVPSAADATLIDDFNDGDDVGWTHVDTTTGTPWGPGIYDATSGAYRLETTGDVGVAQVGILVSAWDASSDPAYSNGFVRAKVRRNSIGTEVNLLVRLDPSAQRTYVLATGAETDNKFYVFRCDPGFLCSHYTPLDIIVMTGEDWIMEAGAVSDRITLRVWQPGEEPPSTPQLTFFDSTYATGQIGLAAYITGRFPSPARVDGAFDDIYFTPAAVGDTDSDGDVDLDDLNSVRNNFGSVNPPLWQGDTYPWDNDVDLDDLNAVRNNFGAGAGAVPEPTSVTLAALVLLASLGSFRRLTRQPRSLLP